jgi:NADH-dependent peroxiredoxin subunit F
MADLQFGLILDSLADDNKPDTETVYDVLIVGGGPAAMAAAVYAARKMLNTAIIAKDLGGQVGWTTSVENYIGFKFIEGKELVNRFEEHVRQFEIIKISSGVAVDRVSKEGDLFIAHTETGKSYKGKSVIAATGKRNRPLNVPGEDKYLGRGVAHCSICDAPLYKDKKVAVAGGGNSAFEAVADLMKISPEVSVINYSKNWQADPVLKKRARLAENVALLDNHKILEIMGNGKTVTGLKIADRESGEEKSLEISGLFVEIGLIPNSEPFRDLMVLNDIGEILIDCKCNTSLQGAFGAGDVTNVAYKQIVISTGEGAKAALSAYNYLLNRGDI